MKKIFSFISLLALLTACGQMKSTDFVVTVSNDQAFDRIEEMVEVPISDIAKKVQLIDEEQYVILDAEGNQVPYQITYNDNLLFPVTVQAKGNAIYLPSGGDVKIS